MIRLLLALAFASLTNAQSARPAFDVTSVKPRVVTTGERPSGPTCESGRLHSNGPVARIIMWAYNLSAAQAAELNNELPPWTKTGSQSFDVQASTDRPVTESECREMAKTLLADRFQFSALWETRDGPVFELSVARGGPKVKLISEAGPGVNIRVNGQPVSYPNHQGFTMPELATALSARMNPPADVIDKTGLTGTYRIDLAFSPPRALTAPGAKGKAVPKARPANADDPELFIAIQQQLGLRLDERKGRIQYLILDRIEPPDPN